MNNIRIATINVRTLQDDIKLATIVQTANSLNIDVLAMQEVRRTSTGLMVFDNNSLNERTQTQTPTWCCYTHGPSCEN